MTDTIRRQCLNCGLQTYAAPQALADRTQDTLCSKCDLPLFAGTDGSTLTIDIAHQRETVAEAVAKFREALDAAWSGSYAAHVRFIVGGGRIRDAVLGELAYLQSQHWVLAVSDENRGSVIVTLRQ